jgi:hypothetical protein
MSTQEAELDLPEVSGRGKAYEAVSGEWFS